MAPLVWRCRSHRFRLGGRPLVMGIVNVTPDSFSDGGRHSGPADAVRHALTLAAEGADLLDIGGESTRPGSAAVPEAEELRRVLPVVAALAKECPVPLSVDTQKASVAEACLEAGASIINDVSGLRLDPRMPEVVARFGAGAVVMHMQGEPATMNDAPAYADVVAEVTAFFRERLDALERAGIDPEQVALDPGIGFGKTLDHNLALLRELRRFQSLGRPVCLGVSRKGIFGQLCGRPRDQRLAATLAANCFAVAQGAAHILRVHDVAATRDAALLWAALAPNLSGEA